MWRTFWKTVRTDNQQDKHYKALDDFLTEIDADGFEPRFIKESYHPFNGLTLIVTARKKDA